MTWTFIGRTDAEMPNLCVLSLTEGREYFFRVIAENRHGRSEPLESEVPVIPNRLFEYTTADATQWIQSSSLHHIIYL